MKSLIKYLLPSEMKFASRRVDDLKLGVIAIVLIQITIAVIWCYRPSYPTAQITTLVPRVMAQPLHSRPRPLYVPATATSQVCQLHGRIRTNGVVQVRYGTPVWSAEAEAFDKAKSALFPNSWPSLHGGCVITDRSALEAAVSICPRCREAEQRWKKEHGKSRPNQSAAVFRTL